IPEMRIHIDTFLGRYPIPDIPAEDKKRNKKDDHPWQHARQVFHLPPDNNTPPRIRCMMHEYPEKTSDQYREKVNECEQPRERKLPPQLAACWRDEADNQSNQKRARTNREQSKKNSVQVFAVKNLRFRDPGLIATHRCLSHRCLLRLNRLRL